MKHNALDLFLLTCIFLLATLLVFYRIDKRCLFGDEVLTIKLASLASPKAIWQNVKESPTDQLPLFYIILHYWQLLSKSILWLRSLSALSGLLSIYVAYRLSTYLFNKTTALLTCYLVSISPFLILYNQVLRYYSFNAFFNLLSLYLFIKTIHNDRLAGWILYILVRTIAIYINYSSLLFLIFEALFITASCKIYPLSFKRWLASLFFIFLLTLPLLPGFLKNFTLLASGAGFEHMPFKIGLMGSFLYIFFGFSLGQTISPFNYPVVLIAAGTYFFIGIIFFKNFILKTIPQELARFLILATLIPIILCILSRYNSPHYIIAVAIIYYIIVSIGILNTSKLKIKIVLIIIVSILNFYSLYNLYTQKQYHKMEFVDSWDRIAYFIKSQRQPSDVIIYNSQALDYYLSNMEENAQNIYRLPVDKRTINEFISQRLGNHKISKIFLVDSPLSGNRITMYQDSIISLKAWLRINDFKLLREENFNQDFEASKKRRYTKRPFPEYRTILYVYSKL